MTKQQMQKRMAYLESVNDMLQAEIFYLDTLMTKVGFSGGLSALKATAQEICGQETSS